LFSVFWLCLEPTLNPWALSVLVDHVEGTDKVIWHWAGWPQVMIPSRGWGLLLYFMLRSVLNSRHVMDIGHLSPEVYLLDDTSVLGFMSPVWIRSIVRRSESDPFLIMEAWFIGACSMMRFLYTNSVSCFERDCQKWLPRVNVAVVFPSHSKCRLGIPQSVKWSSKGLRPYVHYHPVKSMSGSVNTGMGLWIKWLLLVHQIRHWGNMTCVMDGDLWLVVFDKDFSWENLLVWAFLVFKGWWL
jgi:hypothetical protein